MKALKQILFFQALFCFDTFLAIYLPPPIEIEGKKYDKNNMSELINYQNSGPKDTTITKLTHETSIEKLFMSSHSLYRFTKF